jgi:hypothetical protein
LAEITLLGNEITLLGNEITLLGNKSKFFRLLEAAIRIYWPKQQRVTVTVGVAREDCQACFRRITRHWGDRVVIPR